jgi:branched-chain amino acid transport system substrate-binding protein
MQTRKRGRSSFLALWLAAGLAALAGCGSGVDQTPVLLGQVVSTSGGDKYAGEQAERGTLMAVKEQNEQAKDKARPLKVLITDAHGKLESFEGEAVRLVSVSKAVALFGGNTSEEVLRLDRAGVPLLTPYGRKTQGMSEQVFCTGLSPSYQGKVLARHAAEVLKLSSITILIDERREDAALLAEAFQREFPAHHQDKETKKARVTTLRFGADPNFSSLAEGVMKEEPQGIVFAGAARDLLALRGALEGRIPALFFGGPDGSSKTLADDPGGEGVVLVSAFAVDVDVARAKEFVSQFESAYSTKPDVHAALAFDAARLFDEAFKRCEGSANSERFREKLLEIKDFPGVTGPLAFAKDGRLRRPAFVLQIEQGKLKLKKQYEAEGE